jgi:lauroyl/myristoyl acyltransferase
MADPVTTSHGQLAQASGDRTEQLPRRWTLHGLNNGLIFSATYHGVRTLPRGVSYAIARAGTWIAWRTMRQSRQAIADNLAAILPAEGRASLERRARRTLHCYALDIIDFLRALSASPDETAKLFELPDRYRHIFEGLRAGGRGTILVTAHYGNWEIGSLLIRDLLHMPLTIVAMAEANPTVNDIRRDIRKRLGAETIEVRQSLETPLQIRKRLAENQIVAMLIDRHYGRDRVRVSLFGRAAWFLRTPLLMAYLSGAPIVPCFIERKAPARFAAQPGTPIYVDAALPREEAIGKAAQQIADDIADRVRAHPEFWYQFYRYWDAQRDAYDGLA